MSSAPLRGPRYATIEAARLARAEALVCMQEIEAQLKDTTRGDPAWRKAATSALAAKRRQFYWADTWLKNNDSSGDGDAERLLRELAAVLEEFDDLSEKELALLEEARVLLRSRATL